MDLTPRAAGTSEKELNPAQELAHSSSDQASLATKSADNDADRRKFFQSLLQDKNTPAVEELPSSGIPKKGESNPSSPVNGKENMNDNDFKNAVEKGELKNGISTAEKEQAEKLEHSVDRISQLGGSLSLTGVNTELRGAEIADEKMDQGVGLPDMGSTNETASDNEPEKSNSAESHLNENSATESAEDTATLSPVEGEELNLNKEVNKAHPLGDESQVLPPVEAEESADEFLKCDESKSPITSGSRIKYFAQAAAENCAKSSEGQDLLNEKDKPRDVDNGLSIAVKSSYIGAAGTIKDENENKEPDDAAENVNSEGINDEEKQNGPLRSKENSIPLNNVEATSSANPHQPGSTRTPLERVAESSPGSTPVTSPATSSGGSNDQKLAYKAYVNIPEYLWSPVHQRLLGDLLFAIESDIQVWRR